MKTRPSRFHRPDRGLLLAASLAMIAAVAATACGNLDAPGGERSVGVEAGPMPANAADAGSDGGALADDGGVLPGATVPLDGPPVLPPDATPEQGPDSDAASCWQPPSLQTPKTIILKNSMAKDRKITVSLGKNEDAVITASERITNMVRISGGRDIIFFGVEIGGVFAPFKMPDAQGKVLQFSHGRTIHIEGVLIDEPYQWADSIVLSNGYDYDKNSFVVTVQNAWIGTPEYDDGTGPGAHHPHGDIVQTQIGAGLGDPAGCTFRAQNVTAVTNGQGFFLDYRTGGGFRAYYDRVNISHGVDPWNNKELKLIWAKATNGRWAQYHVDFTDVWAGGGASNAFAPKPSEVSGIKVTSKAVTFTSKAASYYHGHINVGEPANDFAPKHLVGRNYHRATFCK